MFRTKFLTALLGVALLSIPARVTGIGLAGAAGPSCDSSFDPYTVSDAVLQACGIQKFALQSVETLPDGGKAYVYQIDGDVRTYKVPPPRFDALNATAAQLAEYDFPPRPTSGPELSSWRSMMGRVHIVQPPPALIMLPVEALPNSSPSSTPSANWSGYEATGQTYNYINGQWNELQALSTPCNNNEVVTWVGMGGDYGSQTLVQAGTGVNVSGLGQHQAWSEVLPKEQGLVPVLGLYAHAGYRFTVDIQRGVSPYNTFYLYDSYSGNGASFEDNQIAFDGSTAEFIVERPYNNRGKYFYQLTNFDWMTWMYAVFANNGTQQIGNYPNHSIEMRNNGGTGTLLAQPDGLYNSGSQFDDFYKACG